MQAFGQSGIPTAFIVDGKGNVAWFGHPLDGMDEVLAMVVAGNFDPQAYAKEKAANEALQKELYELFQQYFMAVLEWQIARRSPAHRRKVYRERTRRGTERPGMGDFVAGPGKKRHAIALKAAEKANTQTKGENPMVLDTYALALFQNGKIAEAVAAQEKAIALSAGNEQMQADLKIRLEQYKDALKPATQE